MSINYESVKRLNALKQSIENVTGKTYYDLTSAVQGLKDNGMKIEDFVQTGVDLGDVILSDITSLRIGAFSSCNVGNVVIPEGVRYIPLYAFYGCSFRSDSTVTLPSSLEGIRDYAFYGAKKIKSITIPEGVVDIGKNAFYNSELETLTIPNSVRFISEYAFYAANSLTSVTIIVGAELIINTKAFADCKSLTTVTFTGGTPNFVKSDAFIGCTNLTTINASWSEGEVTSAPWGATNATINYNYTGG